MENAAIVTVRTEPGAYTPREPAAHTPRQPGTHAPRKPANHAVRESTTYAPRIPALIVPQEPSVPVKFVSAGLAACIADVVSFPLDTAKVRLQLQGEVSLGAAGSAQYRGLLSTIVGISRAEGVRALYNGLAAGLQRQLCFASVRIGLYDSVKNAYASKLQAPGTECSVPIRLLAGITTGGMAVVCAQPTDVVKVRMQAQRGDAPRRYTGCLQAYRLIGSTEGLAGLWKGALPNITRNAIVNCSELVTYDLIKTQILKWGLLSDNMPCHFTAACGAGFVTTVVASPVDVVKTRYMNSAPGTYSGVVQCARQMGVDEGARAFYKGFMPSFMRLSVWNITMFVCYEQLKRHLSSYQPASIHIDNSKSNYL